MHSPTLQQQLLPRGVSSSSSNSNQSKDEIDLASFSSHVLVSSSNGDHHMQTSSSSSSSSYNMGSFNGDEGSAAKDMTLSNIPSSWNHGGEAAFEISARIGRDLQDSNQLDRALAYYRRALHLKHKTIQSEPTYIQAMFAEVLFDVGVIHMRLDVQDQSKSLRALHFCLDLRRVCFGSRHPAVASVLFKLAMVYESIDDMNTALDVLVEALAIFLWSDPHNKDLSKIWMALGRVQRALGQHDDAESSFTEATRIVEQLRDDTMAFRVR